MVKLKSLPQFGKGGLMEFISGGEMLVEIDRWAVSPALS